MRMRPLALAPVALLLSLLSLFAVAASPSRASQDGSKGAVPPGGKFRPDSARVYLELGPTLIELHSAEGGNMVGVVRKQGDAKSIAGATCEPFVLTAPAESLDAMLPKLLSDENLTGAVMYFDANGKIVRRHEFRDARLTEITLGTLDAASKDALRYTMTLAPAKTTVLMDKQIESKAQPPAPTTRRILASQFRVDIDGVASSRVATVAGISLKRSDAPSGQLRTASRTIDVANVSLEVSIADRDGFAEWHRSTVIEGRAQPKSMRVELLDSSLRNILVALEAPSTGIIALRDNAPTTGQTERFEAELFVDGWRIKPSRK